MTTIKRILLEKETRRQTLIPDEERHTNLMHASSETIHCLVNEQTEKDVQNSELKKIIQYQVNEELKWQHGNTPPNIPRGHKPTIIEDIVPSSQPSCEPPGSPRIALRIYHQVSRL